MRKDTQNNSLTKGKIANGILLITIGLVFVLILCGAFGKAGLVVTNFLVGVFGFAVYSYFFSVLIIGILTVINFKVDVAMKRLFYLISIFILVILISHVATSKSYIEDSKGFGENFALYISECYKNSQTAGGAIAGIFTYVLQKINIVFAYILFSAFLIFYTVSLTMSYTEKGSLFVKRMGNAGMTTKRKKRPTKEVGSELFNETLAGDKLSEDIPKDKKSAKKPVEYTPIDRQEEIIKRSDEIKINGKVEKKDIVVEEKIEEKKIDSYADDGVISYKDPNAHNNYIPQEDDLDRDEALDLLFGDGKPSQKKKQEKTTVVPMTEEEKAFHALYSNEKDEEDETPKKSSYNDKKPENKRDDRISNLAQTYSTSYMKETMKANLEKESVLDYQTYNEEKYPKIEYEDYTTIKEDIVDEDDFEEIEPINTIDTYQEDTYQDNTSYYNEDKEETSSYSSYDSYKEEVEDEEPEESVYERDEIVDKREEYYEKETIVEEKPVASSRYIETADDDFDLELEREKARTRSVRSDKGGTHQSQRYAGDTAYKKNNISDLARKFNIPQATVANDQSIEESAPKEETPKKKPIIKFDKYVRPEVSLLKDYQKNVPAPMDVESNTRAIEETLASFRIDATVVNVITGPTFTRYELEMPHGVSVSGVQKYENDIMMRLGAESIFIQAPIPGKRYVGIEVPNKKRGTVGLKEIIDTKEFQNAKGISFAVGQDIDGFNYICDIATMPHLLIAGATGAGKSVCINTLLVSILYKYSPEDVRLILVDPKRVELTMYNNIPHLLLPEALSDPGKVLNALDWSIKEMERRYELFNKELVQNIVGYNKKVDLRSNQKLPYIIIVVDEVADLVMALKKSFEQRVVKLAQKARAAGIHIVLATQRPSVDVITGLIKANLPARMAFTTTSQVDSKTILDYAGAEKLLRYGDMLLFMAQYPSLRRVQGAFIDSNEVVPIADFVRENNRTYFDKDLEEEIYKDNTEPDDQLGDVPQMKGNVDPTDDMEFLRAVKFVIEMNKASASALQSYFAIGYPKAARYIAQMQQKKFIGANQGGNKGAEIYITKDEFEALFGDIEL